METRQAEVLIVVPIFWPSVFTDGAGAGGGGGSGGVVCAVGSAGLAFSSGSAWRDGVTRAVEAEALFDETALTVMMISR